MREYLAQRDELIARAEPGLPSTRALAEFTDEAVRELARAASSRFRSRWAIVALGGWGAGGLLPRSDLDVLVLSEGDHDRLKPFTEAILYPLWDAGLVVGHQVRSPKQQLKAMREDLRTCTAGLTARAIAGDVEWASASIASWAADAGRRRKRLLRELAERPRPGSPYLLEPELKHGAGGRRDYDEITWTAAAMAGSPRHSPASLADVGLLSRGQLVSLIRASATTVAARWELHRAGFDDTLSPEAAAALRHVDPESLHSALGVTALALARVRSQTAGLGPLPWEPLTASDVWRLLGLRLDDVEEFEWAVQAGRMNAIVPRALDLMSVRRPGLGHEFTVGAHSLRTALLATHLPTEAGVSSDLLSDAERRAVAVAALTHDIGKLREGPGHASRGVLPTREAAQRLGLDARESEMAGELVGLHLVLTETALHEDLDDEDTILRCAARIRDESLLAPLLVLTAADSLSTGPSTWTSWTRALVLRLVARLQDALSEDGDGAGLVTRAEETRREALLAMTTASRAECDFVGSAALRYLASRDANEVVRQAGLVATLSSRPAASGALIAVTAGPAQGTRRVTVAARDTHELLARLAGAMALAGLDIHSVDAYPTGGHIALDEFVVSSATRRPLSEETFTALERFVNAALRDRLELGVRLAERRRHYPATTVIDSRVDVSSAGWDTSVRVSAPDRPGLLHDLARAVSSAGLDIRWAKAQTLDGVAVDTFHVVGPDGGPPDDGLLGHAVMNLREALGKLA